MTPERKAQLDNMTEDDKKADMLKNIREHEVIRIDNRQALAFWGSALQALIAEGRVIATDKENYEGQYSWIEVKLA